MSQYSYRGGPFMYTDYAPGPLEYARGVGAYGWPTRPGTLSYRVGAFGRPSYPATMAYGGIYGPHGGGGRLSPSRGYRRRTAGTEMWGRIGVGQQFDPTQVDPGDLPIGEGELPGDDEQPGDEPPAEKEPMGIGPIDWKSLGIGAFLGAVIGKAIL